ncbi:hypothetical protein [Arthrobacter sp. NA-172]|uniref:hypothetical protein n=1 Tax=Arthrobacter sp. NA-172 TaxID=3367524 RepID=UPI00375462B7
MKNIALDHGMASDSEPLGVRQKDYVVVDDLGDFTYYPSETTMLEDLEYVDEAASIIDRAGNDYRLTLRGDRNLRLGTPLGRVEFTWLRQAWVNYRRRDPRTHRLLRLYPRTLEVLLAGIFEILTLELASNAGNSPLLSPSLTPWVLDVGGEETHPATLRDVDGLLAGLEHLELARVCDPFGHNYRPIRHATHIFRAFGAWPIYYVELDPHRRQVESSDGKP